MSDTSIRVNNVSKIYKLYNKPTDRLKEAFALFGNSVYHSDHHALKNVSFSVNKGETVGIIGKNGSGKSTLLKIISGVLTPTYGNVEVNGRITSLLELGAGFNMEYSGIENIYLNGSLYGFTKEQMDKKVDDILDFADIGNYVYQSVKTYSSGMFARLAFSVMAHLEPDILIVDEALSVGDIFFQQKCNTFMKEHMHNTTKLLVTHDMNSIANLANRCIVLAEGHIVFEGEPLEAIEHYVKTMHTEGFKPKCMNENKIDGSHEKHLNQNWIFIDQDKLGGALEASILGYSLSVNNQEYKGYLVEGDDVTIDILIRCNKNIKHVIFGYIVTDRFGNNIFGENTVTSKKVTNQLEENRDYQVSLTFKWPEIKEDDYFITLGIGEGQHELQHIIQCWAHNILQVKSISPTKTIHCLFNNKITGLDMSPIE